MLKVNDLVVYYGHVSALQGISIEVPKGKIVSIIGANGAGKTSLLNTISGLVKPKNGTMEFDGQPIPPQPHKVVNLGLVQVPEGRKIFAGLSVEENLLMGAARGTKGLVEKQNKIFELFPILSERRHQQGGTLSGGEQQMLAIARAMMSNPKMIMFDEPSMGLAPVVVKQVFKFIKTINDSGITVLLIEQNARQAMALSDYTYVLENGKIKMSGNSEDLLKDPNIQKAYLGE
jgi:branched-chain amino acid transport system ATP-binding protein